MYLSNIKLWNFRKYGFDEAISLDKPHLNLNFTNGLNVLIGENDSGKSALIDAIKLVLKTQSYEFIKIEDNDFYMDKKRFRIELRFDGFSDNEAKNFIEWLGWTGEGVEAKPYLRLIYDCQRNDDRILPTDVKAGVDDEGYRLDADARDYLKVTYLKPLRDAEHELIPKRNSRLSQVLRSHEAFRGKDKGHVLLKQSEEFNKSIAKYFEGKDKDEKDIDDKKGKELKKAIDQFITSFFDNSSKSKFDVTPAELKSILEKLELSIDEIINPGLGTLNRLFMAAELLHLEKKNWSGLRLGLIEELEAHIHPQKQMQIIESLQEMKDIQLILTTHSPNLGSKIKLENLIICNNDNAYPMGKEYTELAETDYTFLERFLDTTKANLFFAKGVILVEGWSEELLLSALAKKLGIDLTKAGVSIVNLGNTAFLRYSRIFKRKAEPLLDIPVAIITDLDVMPEDESTSDNGSTKKDKKKKEKEDNFDGQSVKTFVSPHWTLEYCLALSTSLKTPFEEIVKDIHTGTDWSSLVETLTDKLIKKTLKKPEIADRIAHFLEQDIQNEHPSISIYDNDENIKYLIDAIKYASGH